MISGRLFLGSSRIDPAREYVRALDPVRGVGIDPPFAVAGETEVDESASLADAAFDEYSRTDLTVRARFLEQVADNLVAMAPQLAERTALETGLPAEQLERQARGAALVFRKFAGVVRAGRFLDVTIDPEDPTREPIPHMDHRMMKLAIGPVVVFGASNFPISYSVAGGDVAAALASGCPVIVKAHSAHLGSSELQAKAITEAVEAVGLPSGVFSMLSGVGNEVGEALVTHPLVRAVSFTGSESGGMSLFRTAQRRAEPIPVFCEMTSVNPTFVLPGALAARAEAIGRGFVERMLFNVGQACLKPGVLLTVAGEGLAELRAAVSDMVEAAPGRTLLTPAILDSFKQRSAQLVSDGASVLAGGAGASTATVGVPTFFEVDAATFVSTPSLAQEIFGPAALLVAAADSAELLDAATSLKGQLSAAVHLDPGDRELARTLLPLLERRTGRIIVNAFCQPQEIEASTTHGGPFPATTDSRFTSVGLSSIDRFLRPVTYQAFPIDLLPPALRDAQS